MVLESPAMTRRTPSLSVGSVCPESRCMAASAARAIRDRGDGGAGIGSVLQEVGHGHGSSWNLLEVSVPRPSGPKLPLVGVTPPGGGYPGVGHGSLKPVTVDLGGEVRCWVTGRAGEGVVMVRFTDVL